MNVLPIVCAFLLVLGMCAHSFLGRGIQVGLEEHAYRGFMRAERTARSFLVRTEYSKVPTEEPKKRAHVKTGSVHESRREKKIPPHLGKLGISLLFSEEKGSDFQVVYEIAAAFLKELYGKDLFANYPEYKGLEKMLLNQWIEGMRIYPDARSLMELALDDKVLAEVHYKMLKGTVSSYPPLEDYITIDSASKPIYFHFASKELLKTLFGFDIAHEILAAENQKWVKKPKNKHYTLTRVELEALLLRHAGQSTTVQTLDRVIDYTYKRGSYDTIATIDKKSGVSVRKKRLPPTPPKKEKK